MHREARVGGTGAGSGTQAGSGMGQEARVKGTKATGRVWRVRTRPA